MLNYKQEYSPRESTLESIIHGVKGKLPKGELCINDSVIRSTLSCERVGFDERKEFINRFGLDIISISPVCSYLGEGLPEAKDYLWPDINKWTLETALFTFAIVDGALESGLRTLGMQEFFDTIQTSPLTLMEFVKSVEELNLSLIRRLAEEGVNGIILADDIAYQKGLLINPKILREYFLPSLERQVKVIEQLSLQAFYHSDGNYSEVLTDIINVGFVGLHCIDKSSGMDILDLQQKVADRLCLWGHLDVNDINNACKGTSLEELTIKIKKLSDNKRFILGTNSGIFDGMDVNGLMNIYQSV